MKIDPSQIHRIGRGSVERIAGQAVEGAGLGAVEATRPAAGTDQVALSQRAEEVKAARAALAATPEIRHERVAELKAQIESGEYKVDPHKVAERMLNPRT